MQVKKRLQEQQPFEERKAFVLSLLGGMKQKTLFNTKMHPSRGRYDGFIQSFIAQRSIYTSKAYNSPMQYEFIESSIFTKMVHDYLSDEDYAAFQHFLLAHPDAGDVVRGSGGVRKVRWARVGAGKPGGVRVCYYTRNQRGQILLLVIYAKSVRASIPGALLKQIKEVLDHDD